MDKHFEPVTAKSLAIKMYDLAITGFNSSDPEYDDIIAVMAALIEPHIRKPSDNDKSVPARCEKAYNEVILLLKELSNNLPYFTHDVPVYRDFKEKIISVLRKPNPFAEADIIEKDEARPILLPFSLEQVKNGAKVVTSDGYPANIVSDDLISPHQVLAIISHDHGKYARFYSLDGTCASMDERDDLFILNEPEPVDINIYRLKETDDLFVWANDKPTSSSYELIKTIKTTI